MIACGSVTIKEEEALVPHHQGKARLLSKPPLWSNGPIKAIAMPFYAPDMPCKCQAAKWEEGDWGTETNSHQQEGVPITEVFCLNSDTSTV